MFDTVKILMRGASARDEATMRNHYALELIDQKIRETEQALVGAKTTLAGQIQRLRSEQAQLNALNARIKDLSSRTKQAIEADSTYLAVEAANTVASLENERTTRSQTTTRLEAHVEKLRLSVDRGQSRLLDLKQGAMMAKAVRSEQAANVGLSKVSAAAPAQEAQALINEVLATDSPSDLAEIYEEIETGVSHSNIEERLGAAGFGSKTKITGEDVLARFSAQ